MAMLRQPRSRRDALIAGAGFGAAFQRAIRTIVPLAAPHERAGVLSVLYAIAYLALGVPAVLGGIRVAHGGGVIGTANEYGVAVMVLGALALAGSLVRALLDRQLVAFARRDQLDVLAPARVQPRAARLE